MMKKISLDENKNFSKFYKKWQKIEMEQKNKQISLNFRVNNRRIQSDQNLIYGWEILNFLTINKKNQSFYGENKFLEEIKSKFMIDHYKEKLNEFCFCLTKVLSQTPELIPSNYSSIHKVKKKKNLNNLIN